MTHKQTGTRNKQKQENLGDEMVGCVCDGQTNKETGICLSLYVARKAVFLQWNDYVCVSVLPSVFPFSSMAVVVVLFLSVFTPFKIQRALPHTDVFLTLTYVRLCVMMSLCNYNNNIEREKASTPNNIETNRTTTTAQRSP